MGFEIDRNNIRFIDTVGYAVIFRDKIKEDLKDSLSKNYSTVYQLSIFNDESYWQTDYQEIANTFTYEKSYDEMEVDLTDDLPIVHCFSIEFHLKISKQNL